MNKKVLIFHLFRPESSPDDIVTLVQFTAPSRPTMENFSSCDEFMELAYASKIEQLEVFQEIKEDVKVVGQFGGGHEAGPVIVEGGHQICAASSSGK